MTSVRNGSVISGGLGAIALGIFWACLVPVPAQAAKECDDIVFDVRPTDEIYLCKHVHEVAVPSLRPETGKLACIDAMMVNDMRVCHVPHTAPENPAARPAAIDLNIVGTWELAQAGGLWVLEVLGNGTYKFHSEAQDGLASNAGTFSTEKGHWSLKASSGYTDGGSYSVQSHDVWTATSQVWPGTGTWRRRS